MGLKRKANDDAQQEAPIQQIEDGVVNLQTTAKIFDAWAKKNNSNDNEGADEAPAKLSVIICPYCYSLKSSHGSSFRNPPKELLPLWIEATIDQKGNLAPPEDRLPWLDRQLLEPAGAGEKVIIASIEDYDDHISENKTDSIYESWETYFAFSEELLREATDLTGDLYTHGSLEYVLAPNSFIALSDGIFDGKNEGLMSLYESILNNKKDKLALYRATVEGVGSASKGMSLDEEIQAAAKHYGQMLNAYALGASQRQAIHHFLRSGDGDITTVNGPPGTGKTTLLKSVVATLMVEKAITGEGIPPIIAATSANNQAVTNIIKDFGEIFPEDSRDLSERRWLPAPLKSLGLYAPSASREGDDVDNNHCIKVNSKGFYEELENREFTEAAADYFLQCYEETYGEEKDLTDAVEALRKRCVEAVEQIAHCCKELERIRSENAEIPSLQEDLKALEIRLEGIESKYSDVASDIEHASKLHDGLDGLLQQVETYRLEEPFYYDWFSWFPPVASRRLMRFKGQFRPHIPAKELHRIVSVGSYYESLIAQFTDSDYGLDKLRRVAEELKQIIAVTRQDIETTRLKISVIKKEVSDFLSEHGLPDLEYSGVYKYLEHVDVTFRYEAFKLAMHYFEGVWLTRVNDFLEEDKTYSRLRCSPKNLLEIWQRYAKLTPCIVSTAYMLPKFFRTQTYKKPLFDKLDLLIIDEAGQAPAELVACLFSLAKKAVVVGDVHQIEPIWEIPASIDVGNLKKYAKVACPEDIVPDSAHPYAASSGSAIRLAQRASKDQLEGYSESGMHLLEHRRCHPDIIAYCQELIYPHLQSFPLPAGGGMPDSLGDIPHMGYLHIPGESETAGGSRYNSYEAENIADWITSQHDRLVSAYEKPIEEIVAVVTPFKAQRMAIYKQLRDKRCKKITVGTVHSLQGAERPIVIFSPVYGGLDRTMSFVDQKPNLLNVAVSRAKHAFLVFGNMNLFNPKGITPSSLLARHILKPQNELSFPLVPRRSLSVQGGVELLATVDDHRVALRSAFSEAVNYLLIVSPLITPHGLEADDVCDLIRAACDRGVEVSIFTDKTFYGVPANLVKCSEELTKAGAIVHAVELFHNKTLIYDDTVLIEGSFNWLSAPREGEFKRENHSIRYHSAKVKQYKITTLQQLEGR
jgi:hypothetical protein